MANKVVLKRRLYALSSKKVLSPQKAFLAAALKAQLRETELKVLLFLELHKGADDWTPELSVDDICKHTGRKTSSVKAALNVLREGGFILESEKAYSRANKYLLKNYQ